MPTVSSDLRITERHGLEGLRDLREDWTRLSSAAGQYFNEYHWIEQSIRHDFRPASVYRFLVAERRSGEVVGIVPVELRRERIRRISFPIWSTLGSRLGDVMKMASGTDFVCATREMGLPVIQAVISHLSKAESKAALLLVGRVTKDSSAYQACQQIKRKHQYSLGGVDWVRTDCAYQDIRNTLSKKFKSNLRNASNRARNAGSMELQIDPHGSVHSERAFSDFMQVEASGWKAKARGNRGALATNPFTSQAAFLKEIFSARDRSTPIIFRLFLSGRCIAAALALQDDSRMAVFKIGYDEDFRRLMPGHLLVERMLEFCCTEQTVTFMDLVSHTRWMASWNPEYQAHHYFYLPVRQLAANIPMALLRLPSMGARG